ncbi:MAG: GNAT family N-acetyltransferase [Mucilaginibacter sp.]
MMHNHPQLIEITDQNFFLVHDLKDEAKREGYAFVERTIDDWHNGNNKFSAPGENLWGLISGTDLIGIGGLNRDPYTAMAGIGRVRHLYIRPQYRRNGYATMLMLKIISAARQDFTALRLFTDNQAAAVFYKTLGFQQVDDVKVSHIINFSTVHIR